MQMAVGQCVSSRAATSSACSRDRWPAAIFLGGQQLEARQQQRVLNTICSMRSIAQISASPLFTNESYWRRE